MRYFPMFLDMAGRAVLFAGGGEQVAQKTRLLRRSEARLIIMANDLIPELADLVADGAAENVAASFDAPALAAADYVFIATGDDALNDKVAEAARAGGALVNMVDKPDRCDMITPALVDRDPVVVAIGTEGAAPVVAKAVKTGLEATLSPRLGPFVEMLRARRPLIAVDVAEADRLAFWTWAAEGAPWRLWRDGEEAAAAEAVEAAAKSGRAPDAAQGGVTMIACPEEADLTPLRAVRLMQQAETVFHAEDADEALLDLARRDAARAPLAGCPRHGAGLDAIRAAASDGTVVVLTTPACKPVAGLSVEETIGAASSLKGAT
ncbi:MAG: NAD(P)-dependent oxidoreductase [Pseudomonadota bacterium]